MIKPHHQACTMMILLLGIALGFSAFGYLVAALVFLGVGAWFGLRAIRLYDERAL